MAADRLQLVLRVREAASPDCWARLLVVLTGLPGVLVAEPLGRDEAVRLEFDPRRAPLRKIIALAAAVGVDLSGNYQQRSAPAERAEALARRLRRITGVVWVDALPGAVALIHAANSGVTAAVEATLEAGRPSDGEAAWPRWLFVGLAGLLLALGALSQQLGAPRPIRVALLALSCLAGGWQLTLGALAGLLALRLDPRLLVIIAAIGALSIGRWREAALLLFLTLAMQWLATGMLQRARAAGEDWPAPAAEAALVVEGEPDRLVPADSLQWGDRIRVRPRELFPVDGEILAGHTRVDASALLGTTETLRRGPGDRARAGTLNLEGTPLIRVTASGAQTLQSRLRREAADASAAKPPLQARLERTTTLLILAALAMTAAVAVLGSRFGNGPQHYWFFRAVTLLAVLSPAALLTVAPAATLIVLERLRRRGILTRSGGVVEALSGIRSVAVQKTGTLTAGRPSVREIRPAEGVAAADVLRVAASVEAGASHPLAAAIGREADRRGLQRLPALGLEAFSGCGVRAEVGRAMVYLGNARWAAERGVEIPAELARPAAAAEAKGQTVVWLFLEEVIGYLALEDPLRPEAEAAVRALRNLGAERLTLLTSDPAAGAAALASEVGIGETRADLSPEAKAEAVAELEAAAPLAVVRRTAGGNPAASLARASVGIAFDAAEGDAFEPAAEVLLLREDLGLVAAALEAGRRWRQIVGQGLWIAALGAAAVGIAVLVASLRFEWAVGLGAGVAFVSQLNVLRLER